MSDNPNADTPKEKELQPPESPPPPEAKNPEHMIPKSRFDEALTERNELRERLAALESTKRDEEEQRLVEQNRYKELYEGRKADIDKLNEIEAEKTRYAEAFKSSMQSRIERIPEDRRSLIPEYDDPIKLGLWLDRNESLITEPPKPTPPSLDGGSGGGSGTGVAALSANHQSLMDLARASGYDIKADDVAQHAKNPLKPVEGE